MEQPETASISKLCAALIKAQSEFPQIKKEKTAKVRMKNGGTYEYAYADLPAVLEAVTPALNKHGLAVIQIPMDGDLVTTIIHESGERLNGNMPIPQNCSPQELGSYLTYARRYSVTAMLGVAADEDDDAGSAQAAHNDRKATPPPGPPPQEPPEPVSEYQSTVGDLFNEGKGALLGNVDDPHGEMTKRMIRLLGTMGYALAREVPVGEQDEFLAALRDTVNEIKKRYQSPVS